MNITLMGAIEALLKANNELRVANSSENLVDIDAAASSIDWHLFQLCKAIGLDKRDMERIL